MVFDGKAGMQVGTELFSGLRDCPRNLGVKCSQNLLNNSWYIADIEFVWGGGWVWFSWGVDNIFLPIKILTNGQTKRNYPVKQCSHS